MTPRPVSPSLLAARNLAKALLLLAALCAAAGAIGLAIGGVRTLSIFVFAALLAGLTVALAGDRILLGMAGARELPLGEAPLLHATVSSLAARAGVVPPRLYLIPDGHPRALAVGRGPASSAIAVSQGLLQACPAAELEGVLAHEIAHVRARDVLTQTAASILAGAIYDTARIGGFLAPTLRFVLGPVAAAFVHALLSPRRELAADRLAAGWCGSPHGLADALVRLEQASALVGFEGSPATAPLWTIDPFPPTGPSALFASHPPVADRVAALRALDPDWRDRLLGA